MCDKGVPTPIACKVNAGICDWQIRSFCPGNTALLLQQSIRGSVRLAKSMRVKVNSSFVGDAIEFQLSSQLMDPSLPASRSVQEVCSRHVLPPRQISGLKVFVQDAGLAYLSPGTSFVIVLWWLSKSGTRAATDEQALDELATVPLDGYELMERRIQGISLTCWLEMFHVKHCRDVRKIRRSTDDCLWIHQNQFEDESFMFCFRGNSACAEWTNEARKLSYCKWHGPQRKFCVSMVWHQQKRVTYLVRWSLKGCEELQT